MLTFIHKKSHIDTFMNNGILHKDEKNNADVIIMSDKDLTKMTLLFV